MSIATTLASSWPKNSRPSPMARPRLTQPQDIVVAGDDVHDAVLHKRGCLQRVFAAEAGPLEAGHPRPFELLDVGGVDLLERGIALVGQVSAVRHPVHADRNA